jgi:hypothetical protein
MPQTILDDLRARDTAEYQRLCARRAELKTLAEATAHTDPRAAHDYRVTVLYYQTAIANFWLHR